MKKIALTITAAVALSTLAACGGDSEAEAFCGDSTAITEAFSNTTDPQAATEALSKIEVPSKIKDDWAVFTDSFTNSTEATAEDSTKAMEAIANISKYIEDNC